MSEATTDKQKDWPSVLRCGALDMQVCVPTGWSDEEVKAFADAENPCGTQHGWSIRKEGDNALNRDPERQPCALANGFVHLMLDA